MSRTRVKITAEALGTIRLFNPYKFTDLHTEVGDAGELVEAPGGMPEGWVLIRLDEADPEPTHPDSDGHLYVPAAEGMYEVVPS